MIVAGYEKLTTHATARAEHCVPNRAIYSPRHARHEPLAFRAAPLRTPAAPPSSPARRR
jgi:hypothetical protein